MSQDKFTATWVSHSSLSDFIKCPRAYFLKNVYKDPKSGHKIQIMAPSLALGQAVHEVLESLSILPVDKRFDEPLPQKFERAWKKISGKRGGFLTTENEERFRLRGEAMIARVVSNPGILKEKAVKMKQDLPYYWLSSEDNIILCGKIDWLQYFPDDDSVHIVDFKTSKQEEDSASLQLPIYHLLVHACQRRNVTGASYWYLEFSDTLQKKELPDLGEAHETVLKLAKRVKLARTLGKLTCPHDGCYACRPMETILKGEAEFVGVDALTHKDIYILPEKREESMEDDSIIL